MATHLQHDELTSTATGPSGPDTIPALVRSDTLPPPETCVICLDHTTDKAVALPCRHDQFDFSCLGTWLQQQQVCPLCKAEVSAIRFTAGDRDDRKTQVFYLPPLEQPQTSRAGRGTTASAVRPQRPRQFPPYA